MQIHVFKTPEELGEAAAMIFAAQIAKKPDSVLGLATGSSPVPTYRAMIRLYEEGLIDFSSVTTYNLDEYVHLAPDHESSYRYFMNDQLFNHVNIDKANTFVPSGLGDVQKNAEEYESTIQKIGGVDLQLLGVGHNGHIGFNEPASVFTYETNVVTLTQRTIDANKQYFASEADVPKQAISMGIGTIMAAKQIMLIATGEGKAEAIERAVYGPIDPMCPASVLRLHKDVLIMLDEAAASKL